MNKTTLILLLVVVFVLGGLWWLSQPAGNTANQPVPPAVTAPPAAAPVAQAPAPDSSAALQQELQGIDVGNVEQDLQPIDAQASVLK